MLTVGPGSIAWGAWRKKLKAAAQYLFAARTQSRLRPGQAGGELNAST